MIDCSSIMERFIPEFSEMIRETEKTNKEHAFGFSQDRATKISGGDDNDIERPIINAQIGTAHSHTIDGSQLSDGDFFTFKNTPDKVLCYATPIDNENEWRIRCLDKEKEVCAESMFSYPIDK